MSAVAGCETNYERNLEVTRATTLSLAACPDGMKDDARLNIVLNATYRASHLKRLTDEKVAICVNPALADVQTTPPYNFPVAAVYLPPDNRHGGMLQIWDNKKPPIKLRPIMNDLSVITHPPQAFQGVIKLLDGKAKPPLAAAQPAIALMDFECGYSCTNISWYTTDKQAELLKNNPTLLARPQ
ncbi:MAG TPA: hypothetical protein VIG74_04210 [Alphaproteobacteria bacterium]